MNLDREQFEQLLSERADGLLTSKELAELDLAIAGDSEFAKLARRYDKLSALIRSWRTLPAAIDWQTLSTQIGGSVRDAVGLSASAAIDETLDPRLESGPNEGMHAGMEPVRRELQAVDDLVQSAFGQVPEVDWYQLKARISSAIREEAEASRSTRLVKTRSWSTRAKRAAMFGVPLAAAAAIALAVWLPRSATPTLPESPMPTPRKSLVAVSFEQPKPAGRVKIEFDRKPVKGRPVENDANGAAIANGPSQAVPLERVDEVVLY
jgi:anti-sigma factor RsiW